MAGRTLSWPACIGFLAPREMDFPADLFLRVDTSHSGRNVHEVFLQRWGGGIYSNTSVTGVVSDVTVHWPGFACRPDFLKSVGSSGWSLGHCYLSQIDVTGIPCGMIIRFGKFLLVPAGVATLLLMLDYVDSGPIGLWARCLFSSRSLTGEVMWSLFICQYIIALLLMVLVADSRGIPLTTVSSWAGRPGVCSGSPLMHWRGAGLRAPPKNILKHAHVSYVIPGRDGAWYIRHVVYFIS